MGLVSIYNLLDYKKLLAGDVPNVPDYILPDFAGGKVMEIEYYALKITGRFRQPFQRLAPSTYTLKMILLLASDSSQLAYQNDVGFTNDAALSRKLGTLNLNTPAVDAIWAGAGKPDERRCCFRHRHRDGEWAPRSLPRIRTAGEAAHHPRGFRSATRGDCGHSIMGEGSLSGAQLPCGLTAH
jgi:hypothetical protein